MGFVSKAVSAVTSPIGSIVGSVVNPITGAVTHTNNYQANIPTEVWQQQQALAGALQAQMNGSGPNPAQEAFKEHLNQVGAQQAGAISSQKGISPALQARMIANQGAQAQIGGAGQAAVLQAQQQLEAQKQQMALQGQMAQEALGAQGINANIAGQNAGQQNQMTMGLLQGTGAALGLGATNNQQQQQPVQQQPVQKVAHGGYVQSIGEALKAGGYVPGHANVPGDSAKNDNVHAMLSPGEIVIPRSLADDPDKAKKFIESLKKDKKPGYGKVLEAKRKLKDA